MNRIVWDYLDRKTGGDFRRDSRSGDNAMGRRDREDYRSSRRDYEDNRMRDYEDGRDYRRTGSRYDYEDGHKERIELSKSDMHNWKRAMKNADGSKGAHYEMQQIIQVADKLGIKFRDYDEKEFCIAVNMFYSDYCEVIGKHIPHDKMLLFCAEMAQAFLEDEDAPEGSVKLALYYHCIVCSEEV